MMILLNVYRAINVHSALVVQKNFRSRKILSLKSLQSTMEKTKV